jgi:hypothetical protein
MASLSEDPGSLATCPVLRAPRAGVVTRCVCVMLGCEGKLNWADRWQNPTRSQPLRWEKGLVLIAPRSSSF